MNIDIRKHIMSNFKGDDKNTIKNAIVYSIKENDELSLPGLGTFFEIIWNNSDSNFKDSILNILEKKLK